MSESTVDVLPELKQIVGALLFAAKEPLTVKRMRKAMIETGNGYGGPYEQYAKATDKQIEGAVEQLMEDLEKAKVGLEVALVAGAYRLQNDSACGPFVRALLEKKQTMRLSKPALETLAIVAYRQPCLRSEIEEVRGVSVDAVLRKLIDMQLVRVVKRSELPGRPWLFGTTQKFLEHFGINDINDLPGSQELKRSMPAEEKKKETTEDLPEIEKQLKEKSDAADSDASMAALDEEIQGSEDNGEKKSES
ncbi:SMC-Scp complex subunit ScpB [Pontiella agarivorans]|uniref:SMC-Scp complex subunit ScpB n=1 Tax=Pontiella agarivorans TaxID=3038953 RepID=A0ABU5MXV2_9BACT|nr:SMC-Scp complex subunit ScpB [Pontiella agarivorans]MDZ8119029.1 SMC-Scp complex subunit ScpB [Pontiella agarivorans]